MQVMLKKTDPALCHENDSKSFLGMHYNIHKTLHLMIVLEDIIFSRCSNYKIEIIMVISHNYSDD